ncbi:hypothetical protein F2Q69_00005531 [Brassica cretica]|uniref:Uncharacterized protein n=1 Tax=Brassica cretica TaxID=69181 RepID=A0A8S9P834_BRACR|nr:hypothetical protein F2Q69_00005531 [Brassica cretica]
MKMSGSDEKILLLMGSGFESNSIYGSGSFNMRIKAPKPSLRESLLPSMFYVDDTPIRVYRKNPGISYPSVQTMFMHGSVKNGSIVDPKEMPYTAVFQASTIDGCVCN